MVGVEVLDSDDEMEESLRHSGEKSNLVRISRRRGKLDVVACYKKNQVNFDAFFR